MKKFPRVPHVKWWNVGELTPPEAITENPVVITGTTSSARHGSFRAELKPCPRN